MYINVHLQPNEPMERRLVVRHCDRCARTTPERMFKIIHSSPYASHGTATSHLVKYWCLITCPSLWKHHVCMHIYSRNGAVRVILSCTDHMFLVFEHTHSSDTATGNAATRSTFIFADTDTWFITTEQFTSRWPYISITTLSLYPPDIMSLVAL